MKYILLIIALFFAAFSVSYALSVNEVNIPRTATIQTTTLLNATTTNATSSPRNIAGAKSVTFFFSNAGPSGLATSTFSVQVAIDLSDYVTYNRLIDNVTNTNAQMLTRVASAAVSGTTTKTYTMDLSGEGYYTFRCINAITGTGAAGTCAAIINP